MSQCPGVLDRREETGEASDEAFTLADMTRAINTSEPTSPGIDRICYVRLKHLEEGALSKLLQLYTNIWKEGRLASAWKEAAVIPVRKPGEDPSQTTSYTPTALTSDV